MVGNIQIHYHKERVGSQVKSRMELMSRGIIIRLPWDNQQRTINREQHSLPDSHVGNLNQSFRQSCRQLIPIVRVRNKHACARTHIHCGTHTHCPRMTDHCDVITPPIESVCNVYIHNNTCTQNTY